MGICFMIRSIQNIQHPTTSVFPATICLAIQFSSHRFGPKRLAHLRNIMTTTTMIVNVFSPRPLRNKLKLEERDDQVARGKEQADGAGPGAVLPVYGPL